MPMMAPAQLTGRAESGYGIALAGFYCESGQVPAQIAALVPAGAYHRLAQCEVNGHVLILACELLETPYTTAPFKIACYRRELHRFFPDLSLFLRSLKATWVEQLTLSESFGSATLTLLYAPVQELPLSEEKPSV